MKRSTLIVLAVTGFLVLVLIFIYASVLSSSSSTSSSSSSPDETPSIPPRRLPRVHPPPNREGATSNRFAPTAKSFIPPTVYDCDAKKEELRVRHWTLVIGIPSVDRSVSLERRARQRETWFKYSSVYSAILPRYLLGLHPSHDYKMSSALQQEIRELDEKDDVIVFDLKEGKPATGKTVAGPGHWGLEAEVGMSRKAYFWYCHAALTYANADFVAKADDDLFLRANLVYSILTGLTSVRRHSTKRPLQLLGGYDNDEQGKKPEQGEQQQQPERDEKLASSSSTASSSDRCSEHNRFYWGRVMKWRAKKGDESSKFPFVGGMFILMSRPLVQWISQSPIAAANSREPYHGDKKRYKETNHDHEDVMVGRWLYNTKLPVCIVSDCRFHDVHVGANVAKVRLSSIGMHHLKLEEYAQFMTTFEDAVALSNSSFAVPAATSLVMITNDFVERIIAKDKEGEGNLLHGYAKVIGMC